MTAARRSLTAADLDALVVASIEGHRAARRVWWADLDDLQQEAIVAALEARERFDESRGTPRRAYFRRAARFALTDALWAASAPVSGGKGKASATHPLRGIHRVSLAGEKQRGPDGAPKPSAALVDTAPTPDAAVDEARWREAVTARLLDLASGDREVVDALLAEDRGETTRESRAIGALRRRAAGDLTLYALARARFGAPR